MENGNKDSRLNVDKDPWAESFFAGVVNDDAQKPKAPGLYGQFDSDEQDEMGAGIPGAPAEDPAEAEAEDRDDIDESSELTKEDKTTISIVVIGALLILVLLILCIVFIVQIASRSKQTGQNAVNVVFEKYGAGSDQIEKFAEIFTFISDNYYMETDPDELLEGAVAGMAASINDPYGSYHRPGKMDSFEDYVNGSYTGIGTLMESSEDGFLIKEVEDGSPAKSAGLVAGDIITEINGEKTAGKTLQDIENILSQTDATFSFLVRNGETVRAVSCSTVKLKRHVVSGEDLGSGIIYIRIDQFTPEATEEFNETLAGLKTNATKGLILDLRDNPGGYVDQAVNIADVLLPEGVIAVAKDRNGNEIETYRSKPGSIGLPLVLLVNSGTASASELLTGAVRDMKAATVIGTKTYGKAVGQIMKSFEHDGSGISLSAYKYYTPSGECVDGTGITPDIILDTAAEFSGTRAADIPRESDVQLIEAVRVLGG